MPPDGPGVYVSSAVLTVEAVLLNLFQLVVETLFVRDQPAQPLLGVL